MTSAQYAEWYAAGMEYPSDYVTSETMGNFTSADSANTDDYTMAAVRVGDYYVLAFAWIANNPDSEKPDYAGFSHLVTGPGSVTANGTLSVNPDVNPMP